MIAAVLLATALSIRSRLRAQRERRPGAKGVEPLMAARAVVFGQASALVAALVCGMYGGTGVYLLSYLDIPARRDQAIYAGFSVVAGIGVIAAALFLERICKLPDDEDDNKAPPSESASPPPHWHRLQGSWGAPRPEGSRTARPARTGPQPQKPFPRSVSGSGSGLAASGP